MGEAEKFIQHAVAFIDILGFGELVRESEKDDDVYSTLVNALSDIEAGKAEFGDYDFGPQRIINFSDTIVIWSTADIFGLASVILSSDIITFRLLLKGVLCRGAITLGGLSVKEPEKDRPPSESVFGPAIVDAYKLEKSVAIFPRVILNKNAFELLRQEEAKSDFGIEEDYISRHDDGIPYIDGFVHVRAMLEEQLEEGFETCEKIRNAIELNAYKNLYKTRVWAKYQWIASRFNDMILDLPSNLKKPRQIDLFSMPRFEAPDKNAQS